MSVESVLAAAATLREFTVDQLAVFCDEQPPDVVTILDAARGHIERIDEAADPLVVRWRVVNLDGLRRDLAPRAAPAERRRVAVPSATRLLLAEQTLAECAAVESAAERRVLVATAKNHLRQILAGVHSDERPWWSVELSLGRLGEAMPRDPEEPACTRLRLAVALACLAEHDVTGRPVPAHDLVNAVRQFQRVITVLEDPQLHDLVGCFFDLVMAQLVPPDRGSVPASCRLIAALARRRVRAQVEHSVGAAMRSLIPLLGRLGKPLGPARAQGLYQVLGHLADGRDRVVVYADLLQILPRQYLWQPAAELLPGALVVAVTEPAATARLARFAETLEHDLACSPFGSDTALIGLVAHVFHDLAHQAASLDSTVLARSDRTRSELLTLAKAPVWHPVTAPVGTTLGTAPLDTATEETL